jgi:hypothetical protein
MAIKDRKRTRFNRIGIIRLGYKVFWCKDGHKGYPTRWNGDGKQACEKCGKMRTGLTARNTSPFQSDHFVLKDAPDILAFYESQGIKAEDIRELNIMFPFPNRDSNFISNYQVWSGGSIVCEGDGEFVTHARPLNAYQDDKGYWRIKKEPGQTLVNNGIACRAFDWNGSHFDEGDHVACSGDKKKDRLYPHCNLCKLNSMLKVMMADPEIFRLGYYRISTGSGRNYDHLDTMFSQFLPENVQGFIFQLRMVEEATEYEENGQTHKVMKWFLHLEPDPIDMRELFRRRAARQLGQGVVEEAPQLEAGVIDFDRDNGEYDETVIDFETGEVIEEPQAEKEPITREHAKEYWYWATQDAALSEQQALDAIGVKKLLEFRGTLGDAKTKANEWIDAQTEQAE